MTQKRLILVVGGALAALLTVAIILLAVLIGTLNKQSDDAAYRECMKTMGVYPGGPVTDLEQVTDAAEWCFSR